MQLGNRPFFTDTSILESLQCREGERTIESRSSSTMDSAARDKQPLVFRVNGSSTCRACEARIKRGDFVLMTKNGGICNACGKIDSLILLPAGNTRLTLLAKRYSSTWHIVLQWSNACSRYVRIGILAQSDALDRAHILVYRSPRLTNQ